MLSRAIKDSGCARFKELFLLELKILLGKQLPNTQANKGYLTNLIALLEFKKQQYLLKLFSQLYIKYIIYVKRVVKQFRNF